MIPDSNLYKGTKVNSIKTMMEVQKLLKKFGIVEKRLTQQGGDNSFFEFIIRKDENTSLMIKIKIPFIEKEVGNRYNRTLEYDEERSFRYFFHYLKALLSAKDAEIYSLEEIFMAHIVIPLPDGQTVTLGEQLTKQIESGSTPMLDGFDVVSAPSSRQLEAKKNVLQLTKEGIVSMSKICKDPSDMMLGRRMYSPNNCDCDCENQKQSFSPVGPMCDVCSHVQRKRLR